MGLFFPFQDINVISDESTATNKIGKLMALPKKRNTGFFFEGGEADQNGHYGGSRISYLCQNENCAVKTLVSAC